MGLFYVISKARSLERRDKLRIELAPRNQCRGYIEERGGKAILLKKEEFDKNYTMHKFSDGPYRDSFGDRDGESYNPNRQAYGKLKNNKIVYCELSPAKQEKLEELIKISLKSKKK